MLASHRVTRWLANASPGLFATYAVTMAFTTYFAMYSYRKPFAAAHFSEDTFAIGRKHGVQEYLHLLVGGPALQHLRDFVHGFFEMPAHPLEGTNGAAGRQFMACWHCGSEIPNRDPSGSQRIGG